MVGYEQQQYQRYLSIHPAPFFHPASSSSSVDASGMHTDTVPTTRPPLHKSASASILRSTPTPMHTHTIPRMPSRPPPPPPKSKAMMMRIQTGFRGVDGGAVAAHGPASPSNGGGGTPLTSMLAPTSGSGLGVNEEDEGVLVDRDEDAMVVVEAEVEDVDEEDEDEEDYGVVVSRPHNRMLRDHEEERWSAQDESYSHQHPQQHQQPYPLSAPTPATSPRHGMSMSTPKLPTPSPQAIKVENALMALAPSRPSLSSPRSQPPHHHPNGSSSSDLNQQQQGRGLSLTTRLRNMSSLGNLNASPSSPPSASAVAQAGSPPLSALSPSSASPLGLPFNSSPTASPSTPIVPPGNNNKENVSARENGTSKSGGGALSTLLLGIQKKAPKRKLVVSGVAMEDVDAYEAVKRWCEVGFLFFC